MLRVLRLPSFMICTILLSILFFYDIFFVFITPHITSVRMKLKAPLKIQTTQDSFFSFIIIRRNLEKAELALENVFHI